MDEGDDVFNVKTRLDRCLKGSHPAIIADAAVRAHEATRLATRLLNFHLLRLLERGGELPRFGWMNWSKKAWAAVTTESTKGRETEHDPDLVATRDEFMQGMQRVNAAKLPFVLAAEANRFAVSFRTSVFRHFTKRVGVFVQTAYRLSKEEYELLTKQQRAERRRRLAAVQWDICSPNGAERKAEQQDRDFVDETRRRWKLDIFPWDGKPLAYHQKAANSNRGAGCNAHLLLHALWHMRIQRQVHGQRGFSLIPLRTRLVPCYAQFSVDAIRTLLGVGESEHTSQQRKGARKRQKLASGAGTSAEHAEEPTKRKRRPKEEVEAEKRKDLCRLFDLDFADVHDCRGKKFQYTFKSDGYGIDLLFKRDKRPPRTGIPTRGICDVGDIAEKLSLGTSEADHKRPPKQRVSDLAPAPGIICVGCDPGRNEPANMVDPKHPDRKLRMTSCARRHLTTPGNYRRTERHRRQSERRGKAALHDEREADAAEYRRRYVEKPGDVAALEVGLASACSTAPCLLHFGQYVHNLVAAEPVLLPHYAQIHHRKLRFKAHVERQRFESRFIRDIRRTFDPEQTGDTIVIAWGAWGKIAGRPGGVGNKGRPPTIGVGLAQRISRERGIVVAWTPEHCTTKTRWACGGTCVRDSAAEKRRHDDHGLLGKPKEIRGLKVCSCCKKRVNRDFNAALNIGTNGLLALHGLPPIASHDDLEAQTLQLQNDMQTAD